MKRLTLAIAMAITTGTASAWEISLEAGVDVRNASGEPAASATVAFEYGFGQLGWISAGPTDTAYAAVGLQGRFLDGQLRPFAGITRMETGTSIMGSTDGFLVGAEWHFADTDWHAGFRHISNCAQICDHNVTPNRGWNTLYMGWTW